MRAVLFGIATAMACRSAYASGQPRAPGTPVPVVRLRPSDEAFTVFSGMSDSSRLIIRDSVAWAGAWALIHRPFIPSPPLPRVDFAREMIVVAALGRRPSEGYGIVIEDAVQDSGTIEIGIRKISPGSGCMTSAAVTQPVDVARLPAGDQRVRFRERNVVIACGVR